MAGGLSPIDDRRKYTSAKRFDSLIYPTITCSLALHTITLGAATSIDRTILHSMLSRNIVCKVVLTKNKWAYEGD